MWEEITVALAGLGPVALELERNSSVEVRGPGVALCRLGGRAGRPGCWVGRWVGRAGQVEHTGWAGLSWAGRAGRTGQAGRVVLKRH